MTSMGAEGASRTQKHHSEDVEKNAEPAKREEDTMTVTAKERLRHFTW